MSDFTPEHIGTFSLTWLAEVQFQYAPTLVALVSNLVGPNGGAIDPEPEDAGEEQPKGQRKLGNQRTRDTAIIATAAVALLCQRRATGPMPCKALWATSYSLPTLQGGA